MNRKIRILVAKVGCDIHERGALTMLNIFRDAGMEAIYTGRYQTEEGVANAAIDENVDVIAVTDLSGSLPIICRKIIAELKRQDATDIPVICGGLMTVDDIEELEKLGVKGCFPTGSPTVGVPEFVTNLVKKQNQI